MTNTITLQRRFCGPPNSANGGFTCGKVAAHVSQKPVSVRLIAPPPLERPLDIWRHADGTVEIANGSTVVARGRPADLATFDIETPVPPSIEEVNQAMARYAGFVTHPFETCFVCGPKRGAGDGLRIFAGPVTEELVASTWTPDPSLAGPDGEIDPVYVWASLDCPGGWAAVPRARKDVQALVLGELTARINRRPRVGEPCVVMGWLLGLKDRRYFVGSALMSESGETLGLAQATWFGLSAPPTG